MRSKPNIAIYRDICLMKRYMCDISCKNDAIYRKNDICLKPNDKFAKAKAWCALCAGRLHSTPAEWPRVAVRHFEPRPQDHTFCHTSHMHRWYACICGPPDSLGLPSLQRPTAYVEIEETERMTGYWRVTSDLTMSTGQDSNGLDLPGTTRSYFRRARTPIYCPVGAVFK